MNWLRSMGPLLLTLPFSVDPPLAIAQAQPASPAVVSETPPAGSAAHPLTSADLGAFFDGVVPMQLERSDIAGASVLVMQNGQVLLERGYGYADLQKKVKVDPSTTLFRLASISKLSTWIAVMQLQEQGKLDLDTDVNQYLDFKIRPAFGKNITLRNLMTHTGGFEEESFDVILLNPKHAVTLRDFLIKNQPKRIFPPGQIPAYSNYGVGLASYIVQRISGEPFEQYTERHIYIPLKMLHSTFYQPVAKPLTVSDGYHQSTEKPPLGFEIFNPVGAGGFSSTAGDMGRFGSMLLNGGELDGVRILKPETLAAMWTPQYQASKDMPAICMGFYQVWRNNLRWIGHEGDLIAFHSLFFVEPAQKLVLFVAYNSMGGAARPRPEIIDQFSDRYFPGTPAKQTFLNLSRSELEQIEGTYTASRRAESTKLRALFLINQETVSINKEGAAILSRAKNLRLHPIHWKPIARDLWQEVDGQEKFFAIRDDHGRVARLAVDFPGAQLQRVPWWQNRLFVLPLIGASLLVLVVAIIAATVRGATRFLLRRRAKPAPQPGTAWLPLGTQIAAWIWAVVLLSIMGFLAGSGDDLPPPSPSWDKYFVLANVLIAIAILLSVYTVVAAAKVWPGELRRTTKVKYSLVALACVILSWFSISYHLIGQFSRL